MTPSSSPHIVLFFTKGVSLRVWQEQGLLERETKLYEELAQKGIKITFLTWGQTDDLDIGQKLNGIEVIPIYAYFYYANSRFLRNLMTLGIPFTLRSVLKDADTYKTNQMWGSWIAVLAHLIYRKPLIIRCGYELYQFTKKKNKSALHNTLIWILSFISYHLGSNIWITSKEDKDYICKTFKINKKKIEVIPNWIDTNKFKPLTIPQKENHVLFVGRLNEQKNLHSLITAIAETPYTLDIVGEGELEPSLKQLADDLNAKVNFLGFVANDKLPSLYNAYPVYILPSHYEGNPKTLLEAMACGCAVIGTDSYGIRSIIKRKENGLLCSTDSQSIKDALEMFFKDQNLRKTLGGNARRQIEKTQSLDKTVEREHSFYCTLLS